MQYLESILKTILIKNKVDFWIKYRNNFKHTFEGVLEEYDKIIALLESYHIKYDTLPNKETLPGLLNLKGLEDANKYISKILESDEVELYLDYDYYLAFLENAKLACITNKTSKFVQDITEKYSTTKKTEIEINKYTENLFSDLVSLKDSIAPESKATQYLLYDSEGIESFKKQYFEIKENKEKGEKNYYPIPFEAFSSVMVKPGDLYITGGYTSQGKSVYLRYLSYYYLIHHARNIAFFTLEMDAETMRALFYIMHANNKIIFPNTPRISYDKFKKGELNEDEEDFFINSVVPDFCNNEAYGSLKLYKPNKIRFNLEDLRIVIREIQLVMPIDIIAIDYLTLMSPLSTNSNRTAQTDDYNQMIKEFKQLLLTNMDSTGKKYPLIGLTAAQISRQGYQECLKQNKVYNMAAFSMYNEVERSADLLMTILRDPELAKNEKVKLQFLKNRDGEVPFEGKEFICSVGYGGLVLDAKEQAIENLQQILTEFNI